MTPGVLLIHGMWSTPATFDRLRMALEQAGYVTHAPVLPWHDRDASLAPAPELGRLSITAYVDFLVAEAGRMGAPPIILGHSMGSLLAQMVAMRVPHAGLVLLSPASAANAQAPGLDPLRTLRRVITRWGWWEKPTMCDAEGARWGIFNGVPESIAAQEIAALVWDSGRVLAEMSLPFAFGNITRVDFARLGQPALVIVGTDDRITPPAAARATARKLAGRVDFHELPGHGHWLFWGDIERRVAGMILDWLSSLER
ncbi:alpha/beta hydrolase [Sandarakinorhabdus sp.]|uniref:alpha/beta hydrolase n=1 Tax=Sandarakinorhabdus sp. TaxID=1916663 RepID=UPI00286E6E6C|nr:alpha/beta hydrolase [Sandarakinorhabdus sp.]